MQGIAGQFVGRQRGLWGALTASVVLHGAVGVGIGMWDHEAPNADAVRMQLRRGTSASVIQVRLADARDATIRAEPTEEPLLPDVTHLPRPERMEDPTGGVWVEPEVVVVDEPDMAVSRRRGRPGLWAEAFEAEVRELEATLREMTALAASGKRASEELPLMVSGPALALPSETDAKRESPAARAEHAVVLSDATPAATEAASGVAPADAGVEGGLDIVELTPPKYPLVSRRLGEEGTVVLLVSVGANGRAVSVEVEKGCGYDRLERAAIEAARAATFTVCRETTAGPARRIRVPVRFELK